MSEIKVGWTLYQQIQQLDVHLRRIGLCLGKSRFYTDCFAIMPYNSKDGTDGVPHFTRDAELFYGDFFACENWYNGVIWARNYDERILKITTEARRQRREQDERNRRVAVALKTSGDNQNG